ncbi:MAG: hypothetical protein N2253_04475 [Bacteroidia bacterium]|nr:hypothetical protein [Bacteroidia bacterium]
MRVIGIGLILWGCTAQESPAPIPIWRSIMVRGETTPLLPTDSAYHKGEYVIRLFLRRDPLKDQPEWLSGHRYAMAFYLEQLPIRGIVIEAPEEDTAFFRAGAAWYESLKRWMVEEFIPFLRPYSGVQYIAFGRNFNKAPVPVEAWAELVGILKSLDTLRKWGFSAGHPNSIPAIEKWDFGAIDYRLPHSPHERAAYHAQWESVNKPLIIVYANLSELDTVDGLMERRRYWKRAPAAMVLD